MADVSLMALRREHLRQRGEAEYLRKRADIVAAAAEVFKLKGFRSTGLGDVATAAKMDRATLYLYVESKEDVFHAVIQDAVEANVGMVEALVCDDRPVPERLRLLVETLIASYARHHPFLFVYVQENMTQLDDGGDWGQAMRALGRRFDDAVTRIIEEGIDDGSLDAPREQARIMAYGVIGLCNWTHRWFDPAGAIPAADVGRAYADMVIKGLVRR